MEYDILLKGGHLIDPKNDRDGTMDLAVKDGKVAAVGPDLGGAAEQTGVELRRQRLGGERHGHQRSATTQRSHTFTGACMLEQLFF